MSSMFSHLFGEGVAATSWIWSTDNHGQRPTTTSRNNNEEASRQTDRERVKNHVEKIMEAVYGQDLLAFISSMASFCSISFILSAFACLIVSLKLEFSFCDAMLEWFFPLYLGLLFFEWIVGYHRSVRDYWFGSGRDLSYVIRRRRENVDRLVFVCLEGMKLGMSGWGISLCVSALNPCLNDLLYYIVLVSFVVFGLGLQITLLSNAFMFWYILRMLRKGRLLTAEDANVIVVRNLPLSPIGAHEPCPICFESEDTSPMRETPCKHAFHESCLASWFGMSHAGRTCPVCRTPIGTEVPLVLVAGPIFRPVSPQSGSGSPRHQNHHHTVSDPPAHV